MSNTNPNKYAGICSCGRRVDAFDGFYSYGNVYCTAPVDGVCPRWTARQDAQRQADARVQTQMAEWNRIVGFLRHFGFAHDAASHARSVAQAQREAHAHAHDGQVCTRCGGAGGADQWPGWACFDCDGRGFTAKKENAR